MARPCVTILRIVFQIVASAVLVFAIASAAYGILTTGWQISTLKDIGKDGVKHEHGLWKFCTETDPDNLGQKIPAGPWSCSFRTDEEDGIKHHQSHAWVKTVLGLLLASCILGLIGLLFSFVGPLWKIASIVWAALCFLATGLATGGLVYFYRYSLHEDFDAEVGSKLSYEMVLGYSFWAAVYGTLGFFVATILSVLTTVMHFAAARIETASAVQKVSQKSFPDFLKNHTAV